MLQSQNRHSLTLAKKKKKEKQETEGNQVLLRENIKYYILFGYDNCICKVPYKAHLK